MTLLDPSKLFLANLAITIVLKVFPWQLPQRERERERKGSRRGFLGNCLQERENNLRDKEVLERERERLWPKEKESSPRERWRDCSPKAKKRARESNPKGVLLATAFKRW